MSKIERLDVNLERWRWMPTPLPPTRIEVDVAAARLTYFEDGAPRLRMRAVVGSRGSATPLLASTINAIVLNPAWIVPDAITRNEIMPRANGDPDYLHTNGFTVTEAGLRQNPGPDNALGRLEFLFSNPFGVYLHDTSAASAFGRVDRHLSHGCVRLEEPRALAALLLAAQGWTREDVDAAIEDGATERVELSAPTPLFITYWTASPESDEVAFRDDAYGWDAALAAALNAAPPLSPSSGDDWMSECGAAANG
jgi:murein L,D-transpeptidase YcbB/YkuD